MLGDVELCEWSAYIQRGNVSEGLSITMLSSPSSLISTRSSVSERNVEELARRLYDL